MYLQKHFRNKKLAGHPLSGLVEQLDCGVFGWQRERRSWLLRGRAPLEPVGGHSLLGRKALRGGSRVLAQKACATVCRCCSASVHLSLSLFVLYGALPKMRHSARILMATANVLPGLP